MAVNSMEQPIVAWNYYGNIFKRKLKASEKLFEDKDNYRIQLLFSRILFHCSIYALSRWCFLLKAQESQSKNNIIQE